MTQRRWFGLNAGASNTANTSVTLFQPYLGAQFDLGGGFGRGEPGAAAADRPRRLGREVAHEVAGDVGALFVDGAEYSAGVGFKHILTLGIPNLANYLSGDVLHIQVGR